MNICDDNRLTRWGQRRLHGAFEECGGSRTWTVPTIAGKIAPAVTPYDWDRGRRSIEAAIQAGDNVLGHRVQLWWHHQWTDANSQYAVRVLTSSERESEIGRIDRGDRAGIRLVRVDYDFVPDTSHLPQLELKVQQCLQHGHVAHVSRLSTRIDGSLDGLVEVRLGQRQPRGALVHLPASGPSRSELLDLPRIVERCEEEPWIIHE